MKEVKCSLSLYWLNEMKIKEARCIFFEKGVIRRELIADELAFSWLRCKYKGTSPYKTPLLERTMGQRIPIKQIQKNDLALNEMWLGCYDKEGHLRYYSGNTYLCQQFTGWTFIEADAGFNGIGTCLENHTLSMTIGFEHYNDCLCDYVSIGIPLENAVIGIILPLQLADEETLELISSMSFNDMIDPEIPLMTNQSYDLYFFREDIDVFKRCLNAFLALSERYSQLLVSCEILQDAHDLAAMVHQKSVRSEGDYAYIKAAHSQESKLIELLDGDFKGTLYIEEVNWLSPGIQEKMADIIKCKLINSKAENSLFKSDTTIIMSIKNKELLSTGFPEMYAGLQEIFRDSTLCIPSFHKLGGQFKSYLYDEFAKICFKRGYPVVHLSEEVLNLLTKYQWQKGYQELEYIASYVSKFSHEGSVVTLAVLPPYIIEQREAVEVDFSLKAVERQWIEKVLSLNNGNIKKTADQLGITRTTLYKKMDEYQINAKRAAFD